MTLEEFLKARLGEVEARVLREVRAARAMLQEILEAEETGPACIDPGTAELLIRLMAVPWDGHPDYNPDWRP